MAGEPVEVRGTLQSYETKWVPLLLAINEQAKSA